MVYHLKDTQQYELENKIIHTKNEIRPHEFEIEYIEMGLNDE